MKKQVVEFKNKLYWATPNEAKSQLYELTEHSKITLEDQKDIIGCQEIKKEEFFLLWNRAKE